MKIIVALALLFIGTAATAASCYKDLNANPEALNQPVDFARVSWLNLLPDTEQALEDLRQTIERVLETKEPATFANTVDPILTRVAHLDRLASWRTWFTSGGLPIPSEEVKAEQHRLMYLNRPLYDRLLAVEASLGSVQEERFVVDRWIQAAEREGVHLAEDIKAQVGQIDREIEMGKDAFRQNYAQATSRTILFPASTAFDAEAPDSFLDAARARAKDAGQVGLLFTLRPGQLDQSHDFLRYAYEESDRRRFFEAYTQRAATAETDNRPLAVKIANLRLRRAQLIGKRNFAETVLPRTMVGSVPRLEQFISTLRPEFLRLADKEMDQLRAYKKRLTGSAELPPWDVQYYLRKVETQALGFDMAETVPYLEMHTTINRVLEIVGEIYGIGLPAEPTLPVWDPEVRAVRVVNKRTGETYGYIYFDLLMREGKSEMSFAEELTPPGRYHTTADDVRLPSTVLINMGIAKPHVDPIFLTFRQVQSLIHEVGHALHSIASRATYTPYNSFQVSRDFVELPSQLLENWIYEPSIIARLGRKFTTGEPFPSEWIPKIQNSRTMFPALKSLARRGLMTEMDFAWHTITDPITVPAEQFERRHQQAWKDHPYLRAISGNGTLHTYIFMYDYESQFHGYQWSEVLDYDAFESFREAGLGNDEIGHRFWNHILRKGNVMDPASAYRSFRGRDADPMAILREYGRHVD